LGRTLKTASVLVRHGFGNSPWSGFGSHVAGVLSTDRDTRGAIQQYSVDRTINQLETLYEGLRNGGIEDIELD
jgi:hypothetical protein